MKQGDPIFDQDVGLIARMMRSIERDLASQLQFEKELPEEKDSRRAEELRGLIAEAKTAIDGA